MVETSKAGRNTALDFTKGMLVLIMVLYHWLNYFYGPTDNRYLRFLTPSFIFISGFLISNIHLSKYSFSDMRLPKRLIVRGIKIFGVFLLLNVSRFLLIQNNAHSPGVGTDSPTQALFDIFVLGSGVGGGQSKAVAFFVLIPISYLLIFSAVILAVGRSFKYAFHLVCLLSLLCIGGVHFLGVSSPNLELVTIGLLGVVAGFFPIQKVNSFAANTYLLAIGYLLYLGAITLWDVIYPLQIVGVLLSLMIIYRLGQSSGVPGKVAGIVVLLGNYSLLGYIAQIAVLQILRLALKHLNAPQAVILGLSFVLAFALTILSVEVVDFARSRSALVDRFYKAVFA